MYLQPYDLVVAMATILKSPKTHSYAQRAAHVCLSPSQVHGADQRLAQARLLVSGELSATMLLDAISATRYYYAPLRGGLVRGVATGTAGPGLEGYFIPDDMPNVWPDPEGTVRGLSFAPLYKGASCAARHDNQLYELLALLDAVRGGRARERNIAMDRLKIKFDLNK